MSPQQDAPDWAKTFIQAYFHHPDELKAEIEAAGLSHEGILGVIGPAWLVPNLAENWADLEKRQTIMEAARLVEAESVLGPRLMAIGRKMK